MDDRIFKAIIDLDINTVKSLLEDGIDINIRDSRKNTPLIIASGNEAGRQKSRHTSWWDGDWQLVELLLEKGANVDSKNDLGETALMYASSNGADKITELLLDHGAKVNIKNDRGETALMKAAGNTGEGVRHNSKDIVDLLLQYGADTTAKNTMGQTASGYAYGNYKIKMLLLKKESPIKHAAEQGKEGLGRVVLFLVMGGGILIKILLS